MASLLLLGQARGDVPVSNQPAFQIPLDIEPAVRQQLKEIRLFVSRDQGKTWQQRESAKPEQNGFVFHATEDGQYWFCVAAVDLQGRQEPGGSPRVRRSPFRRYSSTACGRSCVSRPSAER